MARGAKEFGEVLSDVLQESGYEVTGSRARSSSGHELRVTNREGAVARVIVGSGGTVGVIGFDATTHRHVARLESDIRRLGLGHAIVKPDIDGLYIVLEDDDD